MKTLLVRARFVIAAIVLSIIVLAAPAQSQQQAPWIAPDASAVNEQTLLRQAPRIEGEIVIPDKKESVLIQPAGREWRYFHEVILRWFGAIIIVATLVTLFAAYWLMGPIRISAGRSGRKVPRVNAFERFVHWLTAVSFVVLGISGLNITFGKRRMLHMSGPER